MTEAVSHWYQTVADPGGKGPAHKLMTNVLKDYISYMHMRVVCALFVSFTNNHVHSSATTMELLQKIQWNTYHQMTSLAFRFYKIQFRSAPLRTQLGS